MEWFQNEDFCRHCYPYLFPSEQFLAAKEEVSRILALAECEGERVLDLCCGPGRHAVEFARRGFQVTGVDQSPYLVSRARERASEAGVTIEWVSADMRTFVRPAAFDLACSLFTSFGLFRKEEDDLRVLRNIHKSLKEAGVLIIEVVGKECMVRTLSSRPE
jgi:SAM-dependent methyltransferase